MQTFALIPPTDLWVQWVQHLWNKEGSARIDRQYQPQITPGEPFEEYKEHRSTEENTAAPKKTPQANIVTICEIIAQYTTPTIYARPVSRCEGFSCTMFGLIERFPHVAVVKRCPKSCCGGGVDLVGHEIARTGCYSKCAH